MAWQKLLETARQIDKLAKEEAKKRNKVYSALDEAEKRLKEVFEVDFKLQDFTSLDKKVEKLAKTKAIQKKYSSVRTKPQLDLLLEDILEHFLIEGKTLAAILDNDTSRNPYQRTKDFMAITYGNATDFEDYEKQQATPIVGFEGKWISIVRSNNRQDLLFASILISKNEDNTYKAVMGSKDNQFNGKVYELNGCLQLLFDNGEKMLLLSFRIGKIKIPKLLQGTFSGITSGGAPIAGIEWLVRPSELPPGLKVPDKLKISNGETDWKGLPEELQTVFNDFDKCYFKINIDKTNNCSWDDLRG